jgi:hypothetical protein
MEIMRCIQQQSQDRTKKVAVRVILIEAELVKLKVVGQLISECKELLKIFSASLATAKSNR